MAVTVKEITLWRREVDNRPGMMAETLGPLYEAGADLRVVMGYRIPGNISKAAIEIYPVDGKKQMAAAKQAGLTPVDFTALLVEGNDKRGLGHRFATALAEENINIIFLVAQVIRRKYSAIFGFESKEAAKAAAAALKKAAKRKR